MQVQANAEQVNVSYGFGRDCKQIYKQWVAVSVPLARPAAGVGCRLEGEHSVPDDSAAG